MPCPAEDHAALRLNSWLNKLFRSLGNVIGRLSPRRADANTPSDVRAARVAEKAPLPTREADATVATIAILPSSGNIRLSKSALSHLKLDKSAPAASDLMPRSSRLQPLTDTPRVTFQAATWRRGGAARGEARRKPIRDPKNGRSVPLERATTSPRNHSGGARNSSQFRNSSPHGDCSKRWLAESNREMASILNWSCPSSVSPTRVSRSGRRPASNAMRREQAVLAHHPSTGTGP